MWLVSFNPRVLYRRETAPGTHWLGGWVDPRAGLDAVEKWKFLPPGTRTPTPWSSSPYLFVVPTALPFISLLNRVNPRYNGLIMRKMSDIFDWSDIQENAPQDTHAIHAINIKHKIWLRKCVRIGVLFVLNCFLTTEPSWLNFSKHSRFYTARTCPLYPKHVLFLSVVTMVSPYLYLTILFDWEPVQDRGWKADGSIFDFSFLSVVQTGFGAHAVSYLMCTR
jgi:hypothetical protein